MNGITTTWKRGKRINHPPHKGTMFWPATLKTYDPFGRVAAAHKATQDGRRARRIARDEQLAISRGAA